MTKTILIVPVPKIGKRYLEKDVFDKFKQEFGFAYDMPIDWDTHLTLKENFDDFNLHYRSTGVGATTIAKRFKKGRQLEISPDEKSELHDIVNMLRNHQNKKLEAVKQFQLRRNTADNILIPLMTEGFSYDVEKTGITVVMLDNITKNHIKCIIDNSGNISEPYMRMNYPYGKYVTVAEAEQLIFSNKKNMAELINKANEIKNALPKNWFIKEKTK